MSSGGFSPEPTLDGGGGTATARFATGVLHGWHAIDAEPFTAAAGCSEHAWALCGALVRPTKHKSYDPSSVPVSYSPCQMCRWTVAARTADFGSALAELSHPLALATAKAILNANALGEDDPEDGAMLQLLVHVAHHAPVPLVAEACSEGECEHTGYEPGKCPDLLACKACSLQHGDWEGEWAGRYRNECLIEAPCAVLLALAEHAGVKAGG